MGGYLSVRVDGDRLDVRSAPEGLTIVQEPRQPTF
jgi:hypothetical protein